ncbi:PAS domain S-box protein [Lentimicrobium sp. L6]|uniref:hybrid sensor histidine kinase/response regulator n=1 Tax=Lentimicrobium sp. L6 TaxID=2735916 RepID=UPI00155772DA|nr:PAS domain S-box protein [Lentimicrobium sp. L6]NPD83226.1 PAS domain S-box protein [Lentimicrobium sp. L6]
MGEFEVLIVEDEVINAKVLQEFLESKGYKILDVVTSGEAAIDYVGIKKPDLILMDIELDGKISGIEAVEHINKNDKIPILYITSQTDKQVVKRAKETEPVGYIIKPFSPLQLEITLEMARKKVLVDQELLNYQLYLEHLVVDRTKELINEVELTKSARQQAIENEIKLKAITTAANDAIVLFDEYGQVKFWNKAAEKMFLYDEEDILDNNIRVLFSSDNENDDFARGLETIQHAIDNHLLGENIEFVATKADGSEIPVEMSLAAVDIDDEHLVLSIMRDISQRKHDLEEIKRFKLISDLANYGLAITNDIGEFVYVNKYFAELIEYEQEEMLGRSFFTVTPRVSKSEIADFVEKSSNIHGGEGLELIVVSKSEKEIPVMFNSVIIRDKYGAPKFYAVSATDIRERKEYEENILKAKRLAEESDRMKTAFLSTISHELRTPLNAIIGFAELIRVTEVDMDDVKDFNDEIYKGGNHLLSIVEDILDISMLESKDLKIYPVEFSLNNLMKIVHQKFYSNQRYDNHNINLVWKGNRKDGEEVFFTDNSKLEQILTKLIDNAFKFSTKGTIEFGYKYNEKENLYDFYVKDEGKGIQGTKLTDIFESFKQAEEGNNRAHDGLGLGLSIVNQLLELMKGEIYVDSELGKGSIFTFNINQA